MAFGHSGRAFVPGQKVDWFNRATGKKEVYDFGYYSQVEDKAVIYEEGEMNMQDSYAVEIADLSPHEDSESSVVLSKLQADPNLKKEDRSGTMSMSILYEIDLIAEHFNEDGSPKGNSEWRMGAIGASIRRIQEEIRSQD